MKRNYRIGISCVFLCATLGGSKDLDKLFNQSCCMNTITGKTKWASNDSCGNDPNWIFVNSSDCSSAPSQSAAPIDVQGNFINAVLRSEQHNEFVFRLAAALPTQVNKPADPTECEQQCSSTQPFCLRLEIEASNDLAEKVSKTRDMFADQSRTAVSQKSIQDLFGVSSSACPRNDTKIENGSISNVGETACDLTASLSAAQTAVGVRVTIPKILKAKRSLDSSRVVLDFPKAGQAPILKFGNASYDATFGGVISRLAAWKDKAVISTANGCVGIGVPVGK